MRTNKTISIDIDVLKEMLEYCKKYDVSFSKLVVDLWTYFKKKNKQGDKMLEEARELMIKFIEKYGFNDEITIASSVLVDKILNKEGAECEKSS